MAERSVLAHPAHSLGERLGHDDLAEHLAGVGLDLLDGRVLVAAVEVAQEVAAVGAVELQQAGPLDERAQHVADAFGGVEAAGGEPRVALDDVRGDQRVLEVERHDLALRVEHLLAQPGHPVGRLRGARCGLDAGVLDDRRQVDLGDVGRPVDRAGVEVERRPVVVVELAPREHQVVDLVDRLALGVQAVQLDVLERPSRPRRASSRSVADHSAWRAAQRQVLQHLLAGGQHASWPG